MVALGQSWTCIIFVSGNRCCRGSKVCPVKNRLYAVDFVYSSPPPPPAQVLPPLSAPTPPHNPTPSTTTTIFCNVIIMHFVGLNGKTVIL